MEHISCDRVTGIKFNVGAKAIDIHDVRGKVVCHIFNKYQDAALEWDGKDATGQMIQAGEYLCKIVYWTGQIVYVPFLFVH